MPIKVGATAAEFWPAMPQSRACRPKWSISDLNGRESAGPRMQRFDPNATFAAATKDVSLLGRNVTSSDRRDGDSELIRPGTDLGRNTIGNNVKSTADAALSQIFYFKLIFLSNPISI